MNIIPDKNMFLVGSSIKNHDTKYYSHSERYKQTLATLLNIRQKVPDAVIVLAEGSLFPLSLEERAIVKSHCDIFLELGENHDVKTLSNNRMKSQAETALLFHAIHVLKYNNSLKDVKRLFKISARTILEEDFDISQYDNLNLFGKYVFKKRISTWMNPVFPSAENLLITRMYSMCPSLIDNYLSVLVENMKSLHFLDSEHAHYKNIPKDYLVEVDKLHCYGWLAGNGNIEYY